LSIGWLPLLDLLALVLVANGAPALLALLRRRRGRPLDGGRLWIDGRPLLGASKTWRGLGASAVATALVASALGLGWHSGVLVAAGAMSGDLLSSFVKRRFGLASSASRPVLDQLPESLIPALIAARPLGVGGAEIVLAVAVFAVVDLLLTSLGRRLRNGT
jgi:CDP-diglyceride synthetase